MRSLIRTLAFSRKEIVEVIRQPRLLVTLVVGPFAILLLFGVGYRSTAPAFETLFVAPADGQFAEEIEQRVDDLGNDIEFVGIVQDRDAAVDRLIDGEVDVVIVAPDDPVAAIRGGDHALFELLHGRLDPFEQATIALVARATVDTVNRTILEELVTTGQEESAGLETIVPATQAAATALREAIEAGSTADARAARQDLSSSLRRLQTLTGSTDLIVTNIEDEFSQVQEIDRPSSLLASLQSDVDSMDVATDLESHAQDAVELEATVGTLGEALVDFQSVEADILVSPFGVNTEVVGAVDIDLTDYYAPGVIALLLQHLAITFAALSLVRERAFGTSELFAVAPLGVGETLVGKYIGYALFSTIIGAALGALMLGAFGVPVAGDLWQYALVLFAMVTASIGIGFVISSVVDSDTQAVNLALIVLLLSIFFSGFFIDLTRLTEPVRVVSWLLPITWALAASRDVLFRGLDVPTTTWIALGAGSVVAFAAAWLLARRRLRVT